MSTTEIYALDLEEELLSHIPDPDSWSVINGEGVTSEIINDPFVAKVFNWQKNYIRENKKPAPIPVLEHEFPELRLEAPQTVIGDLLDRLREQYANNQQRESLKEILELQKSDPLGVPEILVRKGRELKTILTKRGEVFGTGDIERAEKLYHKEVLVGPGASLGWKELNDYFFGMRGLCAVIGAPKTGKSWVLIQQLWDNVLQGRCTWLYSLELPAVESFMRLYCMAANIPFYKYIHQRLTDDDWVRFYEAADEIDSSGLFRIAKPPAGKRSIDDLVHTARDAGAQVILIDQLQYVESDDGINLGSHASTGVYWNVLNKARDYSDEGPILYAHQFNRSAMNSEGMPSMEQAKGSSSIEETATLALGLWSNKDMRRLGQLEIGVLAARNHEYASWEIQIERKYGCHFNINRRTDLDDDE